jgi:hypothetical protein
MAINGVGHNYDYFGTTTNYIRGKATVREAISKTVEQSANLSISDAGRNMLREMASKFEPDSDYTNVRELTIQNTNEVAWEHYTAMRDISSLTLMLMYGKEASNRKQEIDRQHYTIPNQRPKDKHCGKI